MQQRGDIWTICKRFWPIPFLVVVFVVFVTFNAGVWKWLGEATNATAIEGFAAIVQGVFTLTLIVLTAFTVHANFRMARETELMAQETKRMAEVQVEQQRGAIRPVLVLRLRMRSGLSGGTSAPMVNKFDIEVANVGLGPALDTIVKHEGQLNYTLDTDEVLSITIAQQEGIVARFDLDEDTPFANPKNPMRWPRTDADRRLIQQVEADREVGMKSSRYDETSIELRKREIRYLKDLTARIEDMPSAGRIVAKCRDLIGNEYTSIAVVIMGDRGEVDEFEDDEEDIKMGYFDATWSPVTLATLSIREEPQEEDYYGPS